MPNLSEAIAPPAPVFPSKLIALGDSTVYGYGDPEGGGWVEGLRRRWMGLGQAGPVLYNLGVRGDGVKQVAQRLEAEFSRRGELRHRVPEAIILSVGTNDSARLGHAGGRNHTELGAFTEAIAHLIEQSQRLAPQVYFVGMTPVNEANMPFMDCLYYSHAEQQRYKRVTRQACELRQVPYLDIFDLWMAQGEAWRRDRLWHDGLHPNTLGYEALLDTVLTWEPLQQLAALALA
ncbi:MAG: G-D-S-L family lipolytic protein [Synechococcales cyanobacterium CRU_2_2]|nr:G-D-S-L family lipolytic protein [Synechococcales cyanobacterium CRU_2_2]